jgi:CRP-like cAMP-binding protein
MHTLYYALIFLGLYVILTLVLILFWQLTMRLPLQKKAKNVLFTVAILVALFLMSFIKPIWLHVFEILEILQSGADGKLDVVSGDGHFTIEKDLDKSLTAAYIFVAAYLGNTLLGYFIWNGILIDPETGEPYVPNFLQQIVAGLLYAIALLFSVALYYPNLLQGTATTLGASGAIGAFVAADPIKKAITAISLNINKPIKKGEFIRIGDDEGIVDSIGWRAIRLMTAENSLLTIPTTNFLNSNYINHSRPDDFRFLDIPVTVRTSIPPDKARAILKRCGEASPFSTGESRVRLITMESVFSDYIVTVTTKDNDINAMRNDVLSAIWYAFRREGILPYPEGYDLKADKVQLAMRQLNNVPSLAALNEEDDKELAENAEFMWFGYPETVVLQDEVENSLYIVVKGTLDVLVRQPDGSQLKVASLVSNQIFGEMGLLTGAPRTASVRATSETLLCKISKSALQPIIQRRPDIMESLSDILAERELKTMEATNQYSEEQKTKAKQSSKEKLLSLMNDLFAPEEEPKEPKNN